MNKEIPLTTENTAQEPIGWGIETTDGVTKPFPYFENSEVVGGENFWPTQDGAREGAAIANAKSRAAEHPLREATISGAPIHSGTTHPEAFLVSTLYAHALGQTLRGLYPGEDEDFISSEMSRRLSKANEDIVRAHTTCGASSSCSEPSAVIDDKQIIKEIETARFQAIHGLAIAISDYPHETIFFAQERAGDVDSLMPMPLLQKVVLTAEFTMESAVCSATFSYPDGTERQALNVPLLATPSVDFGKLAEDAMRELGIPVEAARIVDAAAVPLFVGEPREDAAPLPILDPIYVELRVGEDGVPKLGSWARTAETYIGAQRMPNTTVICIDRARRVRSENGCLVAYTDGEQKLTPEEVNEVFGVGGVNA